MISSKKSGTVIFLSTPSARRATLRAAVLYAFIIFLSTPSARRATGFRLAPAPTWVISIHALREEGDNDVIITSPLLTDFYPRPPRGGRRS